MMRLRRESESSLVEVGRLHERESRRGRDLSMWGVVYARAKVLMKRAWHSIAKDQVYWWDRPGDPTYRPRW